MYRYTFLTNLSHGISRKKTEVGYFYERLFPVNTVAFSALLINWKVPV